MIVKQCPYCPCEDACGREGGSTPPSSSYTPDVFTVYAALMEFYSQDPTVLETDELCVAQDLVYLGYLNHPPLLVDVGSCLDLIREVERD